MRGHHGGPRGQSGVCCGRVLTGQSARSAQSEPKAAKARAKAAVEAAVEAAAKAVNAATTQHPRLCRRVRPEETRGLPHAPRAARIEDSAAGMSQPCLYRALDCAAGTPRPRAHGSIARPPPWPGLADQCPRYRPQGTDSSAHESPQLRRGRESGAKIAAATSRQTVPRQSHALKSRMGRGWGSRLTCPVH